MVNETELQVNMAAVVRIDDTSEGSVFDRTEAQRGGGGGKKKRRAKKVKILSRSGCGR